MVVQHNLRAMNSNRMLGLTQSQQAKSSEKLSSGYKINRAADDAAGLSISEKMRKQIRGLTQASLNAQDGISAVQTAEGALHEVQDMLQRMNELAVKACNGTMSETDRQYIQNEVDQLISEIDRVSETTKFNEAYLLKGDTSLAKGYTYSYKNFGAAQASAVTFSEHTATKLKATYAVVTPTTQEQQDAVNELLVALRDQGIRVSSTSDGQGQNNSISYGLELLGSVAEKYTVTGTAAEKTISDKAGNALMKITVADGDVVNNAKSENSATLIAKSITAAEITAAKAQYYDQHGNAISENALDKYFTTDAAGAVTARADAPELYDAVGNKITPDAADIDNLQDLTAALSFELHVGADGTANNKITLNLNSMSAKGLGVNSITVNGKDDTNALKAIETVKEAIQKISTQRSALGAVQNRLEHTINNLDNVVENTTAAESQIRDTDMATEMVKFSNNNILAQAGQAMLAQSNQANQGVLALLQ